MTEVQVQAPRPVSAEAVAARTPIAMHAARSERSWGAFWFGAATGAGAVAVVALGIGLAVLS